MARDALAAHTAAVTGESIAAVHAAIERRRHLLHEVDCARIARFTWGNVI